MTIKERITLSKEQETLLVPLFSKAADNPILKDERAHQILEGLSYDFKALKVPEKTAVTLRIRAKKLDAYTQAFLEKHPEGVVIHMGCGLDSRCERVSHPQALWYDLDLPDVIALRRKFYAETDTYRMIPSSVTCLDWMDRVAWERRPLFVIAEGLLMYLPGRDVRNLITCLDERFPGCRLVFDAFSKLTVSRIQDHPSIQKTGATVQWGIDDPHEIETWGQGIKLEEEWFFSQSPDIERLSRFYRVMFRLTEKIKAAQTAHRILYYTL